MTLEVMGLTSEEILAASAESGFYNGKKWAGGPAVGFRAQHNVPCFEGLIAHIGQLLRTLLFWVMCKAAGVRLLTELAGGVLSIVVLHATRAYDNLARDLTAGASEATVVTPFDITAAELRPAHREAIKAVLPKPTPARGRYGRGGQKTGWLGAKEIFLATVKAVPALGKQLPAALCKSEEKPYNQLWAFLQLPGEGYGGQIFCR